MVCDMCPSQVENGRSKTRVNSDDVQFDVFSVPVLDGAVVWVLTPVSSSGIRNSVYSWSSSVPVLLEILCNS